MSGYTRMDDDRTLLAMLAAGRAERFGGGKLDAPCAGHALGEWATSTAETAGFASRIIVVSDDTPAVVSRLEGWRIFHNPDAAGGGIASSIRVASRAASGYARIVIALADMPLVEPAHIYALAKTDGVVFTRYPDGSSGVPAAFPARCFQALAIITSGAASINWGETIRTLSPPTPCSLFDVDTTADLAEADARLATKA